LTCSLSVNDSNLNCKYYTLAASNDHLLPSQQPSTTVACFTATKPYQLLQN
jgi:hypothetical protein